MERTRVYEINTDIEIDKIGNVKILYKENKVCILQELESAILDCFDGKNTLGTIDEILGAQYKGYCSSDFEMFVNQLAVEEIIKMRGECQ